LCLAACTRSTPFIHVDHDVSLPSLPSTPRTGRRRLPLDCRFRSLSRRVSTHRQFPPRFCVSRWPFRRITFPHAIAPGVGASDQRFWLLLSLRPSRAGLVSHMAQASPRRKRPGFRVRYRRAPRVSSLPTATPTRTSLSRLNLSFPCLPAVVRRRPSSSSTTSTVAPRWPWPVPGSSRTVVFG